MTSFDSLNTCENKSFTSAYVALSMLTAFAAIVIPPALKFVESQNPLDYEDRSARLIAGFFGFLIHILHTTRGDFTIDPTAKLIAIGPHRTGWEAMIIASKMKGTPPQFLATDKYNSLPGVTSIMRMFKAITVDTKNKSAALTAASKVLHEQGCVALFPQGRFSRLGQDPGTVYSGAAKLALEHKIPLEVIRLDGFWSLQNQLIPLFIRNNDYFRAFLSFLHLNNIRAKHCATIDFHLKPENNHLSDEQKIEEINAQQYAFYRKTEDLTATQINLLKKDIAANHHHSIWSNKSSQNKLQKESLTLNQQADSMGGSDQLNLHLEQNNVELAYLKEAELAL